MAGRSPYVKNWIICIGGFMQSRSMSTVGICGLARQLRNRYDARFVNVDYNPWKTDWNATAEWIYRWSGWDQSEPNGSGGPPTIMIVAYSWGAGWGMRQLCEYLSDRGLEAKFVVVSDAVRHVGSGWCHSFPFYFSQILAYWPFWKIEKPVGIAPEGFYWFRQARKRGFRKILADLKRRSTLLYGHTWIEELTDETGKVKTVECPNGKGVNLVNHSNMDDAYDFRSKVIELADSLFLTHKV